MGLNAESRKALVLIFAVDAVIVLYSFKKQSILTRIHILLI